MARVQRYIDSDVLTEARRRLRHIYDTHDSVSVNFSGGKDSLVCLELAWQVVQERGGDCVHVTFYDEELIPNTVVEFVNGYRQQPWVKLNWWTVPLKSDKFILGKRHSYVQWDRDRKHVREKPPWSISLPDAEYRVLDQYSCQELFARHLPGKVAFITGIRCSESLVRLRSVVNKLHECYLCGSGYKRVSLAKPIYDWTENDVFKFLGEHRIPWCPHYDAQHLAGMQLRVSTPLHSESAKRMHYWRAVDPVFYQRVLDVFPEVRLQDRYWRELDHGAAKRGYTDGWPGCLRYIREQIGDPRERKAAMRRYEECYRLSKRMPLSYTPELLLGALTSGSLKRTLLPIGVADQKKAAKRRAEANRAIR